jgi:hypothetical protein
MPRLKPKTRDDLVVEDFGDELVVGDPWDQFAVLHHLNPAATLVFRLCQGTGTSDDLAAEIADAFGLPVEAVQKDVRQILRQFRQSGLLTAKPVVRRQREVPEEEPAHEHEHDHDHHHDHGHAPTAEAVDEREEIREQEPENE